MRLAWIALLSMISYGMFADSQPPVPTPSKPAQINQRGTEHNPYSFCRRPTFRHHTPPASPAFKVS
jgi:hypothetical protein